MPRPRKTVANPLSLRDDIDAGRTGDKVGFPDPAAAPLGTDDEAAGTPISPEQLHLAQRAERARGSASPDAERRPGWARSIVLVLVLAVLLAAALAFALRP
ncbi:hypothetical protein [Paracoccus aminovorans]|uniref:hypothetical protein n=1 Tax=Paracoccus aminovorans TaxID=34004 RepID=UPI002B261639|nr:hypothetical protein [Paracoccus aminovorans]